jgi:hypothetical protein
MTNPVARALMPMSLSIPKAENRAEIVGRTPWSARVPLDPPVANEFNSIQIKQADEGVGCGPGGPPHDGCKLHDIGKLSDIAHSCVPRRQCRPLANYVR